MTGPAVLAHFCLLSIGPPKLTCTWDSCSGLCHFLATPLAHVLPHWWPCCLDPHLTLAGSLCGRHALSWEDPTPYSWLRLCPSLQPTRGGSALPDSPSPLLADHSALLHPLKATEGLSKVQTDLILLCFNWLCFADTAIFKNWRFAATQRRESLWARCSKLICLLLCFTDIVVFTNWKLVATLHCQMIVSFFFFFLTIKSLIKEGTFF